MSEAREASALTGKVVVVTGGSRGIGLAAARAAAREGARVVVCARGAERVAAAVAAIVAEGHTAVGVVADVSAEGGAERLLAETLDAFGNLDVLLCCAGLSGPVPRLAWKVPASDARAVLAVNLGGTLDTARVFLGWMAPAGRGRVVLVSSGAGTIAARGFAPYVASKFGVEGLVRALALDATGTGVVVTAVQLGSHKTDMTAFMPAAVHAALPPPEAAWPSLRYAATGPGPILHGRSLAAWRMRGEPGIEALLSPPYADAVSLTPPPGPVSRHAPDVVPLDRCEAATGPSPAAREALVRLAASPALHLYPEEGVPALRGALAAALGLPEDCFAFGPGSTELIDRLLRLFVRLGETVVASDPGWAIFEHLCDRQGVRLRRVPMRLGARPNHALDAVAAAFDETVRLIYLVSPSNPVGVALDTGAFRAFMDRVPPQATVVIDEAYIDYATRPEALRATSLVEACPRRLVVVRTFSKLHGLAGLRIGYAVARREIIRLIERLEPAYPVSAPAVAAAVAALGDTAHAEAARAANAQGRERLQAGLRSLGLAHVPSDANFIFAALPAGFADECRRENLRVPVVRFLRDRWAALPVGRPEENERMLTILARVCG